MYAVSFDYGLRQNHKIGLDVDTFAEKVLGNYIIDILFKLSELLSSWLKGDKESFLFWEKSLTRLSHASSPLPLYMMSKIP